MQVLYRRSYFEGKLILNSFTKKTVEHINCSPTDMSSIHSPEGLNTHELYKIINTYIEKNIYNLSLVKYLISYLDLIDLNDIPAVFLDKLNHYLVANPNNLFHEGLKIDFFRLNKDMGILSNYTYFSKLLEQNPSKLSHKECLTYEFDAYSFQRIYNVNSLIVNNNISMLTDFFLHISTTLFYDFNVVKFSKLKSNYKICAIGSLKDIIICKKLIKKVENSSVDSILLTEENILAIYLELSLLTKNGESECIKKI